MTNGAPLSFRNESRKRGQPLGLTMPSTQEGLCLTSASCTAVSPYREMGTASPYDR